MSSFHSFYRCPACLGQVEWQTPSSQTQVIRCTQCERQYLCRDGIPFFLLLNDVWDLTSREVKGEREFVEALPQAEHLRRNRFENERTWKLLRQENFSVGGKVLDAGGSSGIGAYLFHPWRMEVHIVDIVPYLLRIGKACLSDKMNASFSAAEMEWLPYPAEFFDVVFCRQAFHHAKQPFEALREMFRVLKPGGRLLMLGEPCLSIVDRFRSRPAGDTVTSNGRKEIEILGKLPDENFNYMWRDYARDFASLTDDFTIEPAEGAPSAVATSEGLRFDPNHRERSWRGKLINKVLPGHLGYGGDVNIKARKTKPVLRIKSCPYPPAGLEQVEDKIPDSSEMEDQKAIFPRFFEGLDFSSVSGQNTPS